MPAEQILFPADLKGTVQLFKGGDGERETLLTVANLH